MDQFENEELRSEPEYTDIPDMEETMPLPEPEAQTEPAVQPEPEVQTEPDFRSEGQPYSGAGAGRRESPFADSPYVMNHSARQERVHQEKRRVKQPRSAGNHRGGMGRKMLAAVLAVAVLAGSCGITAAVVNNHWEEQTAQLESRLNDQIKALQTQMASSGNSVSGSPGSGTGMTPGQVYALNVQSVVQVSCEVVTSSVFGQSMAGTSVGSGFILTEGGYVVTNYHVIEGATAVSVSTYLGEDYKAEVIGYDAANDVAVLKVEAQELPAVTIGSSSDLIVGDQVVAIGNALGELTGTMTVGYVSAKDRDVTTDGSTINMIQTDAAINSGNSGGPLFNMRGEVVGITTAKYSGESSSGATIEGIGFAIPIDDVLSMVEDLVNLGYITGAYLGVGVNDVEAAAQSYGIPAGAHVLEVNEGSCAEKAGVEVGDIITDLGGYEVENYTDLKAALRKFKAGDTTTITVYRKGQNLELTITLDEKPQTTTEAAPENGQNMPGSGSYEEWYNYFFNQR